MASNQSLKAEILELLSDYTYNSNSEYNNGKNDYIVKSILKVVSKKNQAQIKLNKKYEPFEKIGIGRTTVNKLMIPGALLQSVKNLKNENPDLDLKEAKEMVENFFNN